MSKKKEINEKTFELNITNELLNTSKSFIWYLKHSPVSNLLPELFWDRFLNNNILFAEGLTQTEEADSESGGYDVSINYIDPNSRQSDRVMFLQYKAGWHYKYCMHPDSQFKKSKSDSVSGEHISFSFNDAAKNTQHSILRDLAQKIDVQPESVMYVFPRIIRIEDFRSKIGKLIFSTSFIPVLDLNYQALNSEPPVVIGNGKSHNYRTSYDGTKSEVNYYYFSYNYKKSRIAEFLSELICIQIERVFKYLKKEDKQVYFKEIEEFIKDSIKFSLENLQIDGITISIILDNAQNYLKKIEINKNQDKIPKAPDNFTTIIVKNGLNINMKTKHQTHFSYQVF